MKFTDLKAPKHRSAKRVGRGIAAGQGKTAGRGTKGYGARTGSKAKPGFVGGQNPLMQALPKLPGFTSKRTPAENVHTNQLEQFSGKTVTTAVLHEAKLISHPYVKVKLLARGELTKKVTVELQAASSSAIEAIEKAGGTFKAVPRVVRPMTSEKKIARKAAAK
jgi:large subunit ribosomal protein L15